MKWGDSKKFTAKNIPNNVKIGDRQNKTRGATFWHQLNKGEKSVNLQTTQFYSCNKDVTLHHRIVNQSNKSFL